MKLFDFFCTFIFRNPPDFIQTNRLKFFEVEFSFVVDFNPKFSDIFLLSEIYFAGFLVVNFVFRSSIFKDKLKLVSFLIKGLLHVKNNIGNY